GGGFGNIPATMQKRCSPEDRMKRLLESGGTEACEEAVVKGLDWLQSTQHPDGSWGRKNAAAMTGLAILSYLGHCETPISEKYGDTVLKGMTYLVDLGMKQNGRLSTGAEPNPQPYEHAIATYALGESSTFCKQLGINVPNLHEVTQKAGQYIINNQHESGGWDYGYKEASSRGGDLSVTAWQIQALKACKHTGMDFKNMKTCINRALDYVGDCQFPDGGFGYAPKKKSHAANGYFTLTGAGMLSYQMWDKGSAAPVRQGSKYVIKHSKYGYDTPDADLYGHYYESQAMIARGGQEWEHYNKMFRDEHLSGQAKDGSWRAPGGGQKLNAVAARFDKDTHYRTCLAILMLETYYRFLPATGAGIQ
ncbi:MAG: prenyltransferase/squalene oxidase repeat-containing protein, partial [Verrucomicrobiales bacterium]